MRGDTLSGQRDEVRAGVKGLEARAEGFNN